MLDVGECSDDLPEEDDAEEVDDADEIEDDSWLVEEVLSFRWTGGDNEVVTTPLLADNSVSLGEIVGEWRSPIAPAL